MLIHKPTRKQDVSPYEFVDFRETAPAAATEDMFKDNVNASIYGGQARYSILQNSLANYLLTWAAASLESYEAWSICTRSTAACHGQSWYNPPSTWLAMDFPFTTTLSNS